jgi:hypothetical protein
MSQFVFLYRLPPMAPPTPQQMQERMQVWMEWMRGLQQKGHVAAAGHPLANAGGVVKDRQGTFSDGPYAETKDIVIGFTVIEAKDLSEALTLAAGCPMLGGGSGALVEVRPVAQL